MTGEYIPVSLTTASVRRQDMKWTLMFIFHPPVHHSVVGQAQNRRFNAKMVCVVEGKIKIKIHFLSYCTCSLNNAQRLRGLDWRGHF